MKIIIRKISSSLILINNFILIFKYYLYNYWLTFFPVHSIRLFYLRNFMNIPIGKNSFIHMGCIFYENVVIGNNTVVGRSCRLLGNITVKNNVSITAESYLISSSHYKDSPVFESFTKPILIEDYAWIGARSMVMPGVIIGKGAILGANSIAVNNIPSYAIYGGNPAKMIGKRLNNQEYILMYNPLFQ